MHYIIIAIIIIGVVILLGKYVLFHPVVNSAIVGIIWMVGLVGALRTVKLEDWPAVAFPISIMCLLVTDCIRDIIIAKDYYEDIEIAVDKLFLVKSISSILTFGFSRVIFLLVVGPILSLRVLAGIKKKMKSGYPIPYNLYPGGLQACNYYYRKRVTRMEKKGLIVSNIKTICNETKARRKKLDSLYPKKFTGKVADMVAGDKILKEKRKAAEARLQPQALKNCYAYLSSGVFEQYPKLITEAMSDKGCFSVSVIKGFEELKSLHLTFPSYGKNTEWSEYFIIQALQPLVSEGIFEDNDNNDNDVFDNHAYRYTKSTAQKKIIDADNDPRFAIDD